MLIAEVSERFDIPQDTLRYYERIGLIPRVNRTKKRKSGLFGGRLQEEMKKTLDRLDYKVASYETTIGEKEKTLRIPENSSCAVHASNGRQSANWDRPSMILIIQEERSSETHFQTHV